jgi:hypothetical protein
MDKAAFDKVFMGLTEKTSAGEDPIPAVGAQEGGRGRHGRRRRGARWIAERGPGQNVAPRGGFRVTLGGGSAKTHEEEMLPEFSTS